LCEARDPLRSKLMAQHYRLPSIAIQFAEDTGQTQIQLFRTGKFHHDQYGTFEITPKMLGEMKANFEKRVRGIDIAVDYKHDSEDVAAGWIKSLELKENGSETELWAQVDWTPKASKVLADKEFRYISPDFTFNYQDNETLKKHGPVLLGAGLTNRPVIKKMEPAVELTEGEKLTEERKTMSEEKTKELEAKLELAEKNAQEAIARAEKLEQETKLAEKKMSFAKLLAQGKVCAAQEDAYLSGDTQKFAELSRSVKLSEQGSGAGAPEEVKEDEQVVDAQEKIHELAEKRMSEKKIRYHEAVSQILSEQKELAAGYNKLFNV
jgi:phage I-like protein